MSPTEAVVEPKPDEKPEPTPAEPKIEANPEPKTERVEPLDTKPASLESRILENGHVKNGRAALAAVASTAARSVKRTADGVASARDAEDAAWKDAEVRAELPELTGGKEPLSDLALRLDREADFYRTLAVRAMRPGPGRLIALLSSGVALVGGTMLALAAGVRAFFGAGIGETPGAEALALALMLGVSAGVGLFIESEQRSRAQAALSRAEFAERRLERIAAVLALKLHDPKRFVEALTRLEREPTR